MALKEINPDVLAAARRGDERAFAALVRHYDRGLRALAYRLLGDQASMDDALQEAYVNAYRALPRFRGECSVGTWLYRIAYNACLDELRRRRPAVALDSVYETADERPGPAERAAVRQGLAAALAALSPEDRVAVLLVDAWGFDYLAAARVLGMPAGTLASRLHRARAALRERLGDLREGVSR